MIQSSDVADWWYSTYTEENSSSDSGSVKPLPISDSVALIILEARPLEGSFSTVEVNAGVGGVLWILLLSDPDSLFKRQSVQNQSINVPFSTLM